VVAARTVLLGQPDPGAGAGLAKGAARVRRHKPLIGIGHVLIVTFGETEAAGLKEVILRIGKFLGIGARLVMVPKLPQAPASVRASKTV